MKKSATITMLLCMLSTSPALAEQWAKVVVSASTDSEVSKKINELGLSCDFLVSSLDGSSILTSCRDRQDSDSRLGLYILNKKGDSFTKNLLFSLGDASTTSSLELHSPKTMINRLAPQLKDKADERIVLIDVKDEGTCYATEVFHLSAGEFKHAGSVEFSTLSYIVYPDAPTYETTIECLSQYSRVNSKNGKTTLTFSAPQLYKMDSNNGDLIPLKKSELTYRLSASRLTRIK